MNGFNLIRELDKRIEFHRTNLNGATSRSNPVGDALVEIRNAIVAAEPPATPACPGVVVVTTKLACPFCGDDRPPHIEHETLEFPMDEKNVVHFACCKCCGAQGPLADSAPDAELLWRSRWAPGKSAGWREFFPGH